MVRRFKLVVAGFLIVLAIAAATIWHFSVNMRDQIEDLSAANSDSTQWFLAQSEVELLTLRDATMRLNTQNTVSAQELRNRFDIFYSRLNTLRFGKSFAGLRQDPVVAQSLANVQSILDSAIPLIDGGDAALIQAAPDLLERFQSITPDLRAISVEGVRYFSRSSDERREKVVQTYGELVAIILTLFAVLTAAVLILIFMVRSVRAQNESITWARNRLRTLIETSIDAIVVADEFGIIHNYNQAAERIYGFSKAEALGADMRDLLTPPERMDAVNALLDQMRARRDLPVHNSHGVTQSTAMHKAGHMIPVEVSLSINQDRRGPMLVAFVRDVTRRFEAEAELINARDRALEGERAKARMIAVMNHEMRTPLNGVLGTLDLMKQTQLDTTQRRFLSAMDHSAQLLLQHVNDVLDASRAYNDKIELNLAPFDPTIVIPDMLEGMRAAAEQRGNTLRFEYHGDNDRPLMGDVGKIRQVLVNLVGNAIKFTSDGLIVVQLDRIGTKGRIELQVSDTGSGIPDEDLDRIFDEFVTLGSFFDRKAEGTGLGLSIVKRLVEAMGGQIDVVSEPGEGSAFTVRLPLDIAADEAPVQPAAAIIGTARHDGCHILLVEDNEINRLVAREMIKSYGCDVTEAVDGLAGVEAAALAGYNLILMDISMPRMNGLDAARQIRSGGGPNATTPIVALTAHAMPDDLARFREAGLGDTLIKPLDRAKLKEVLDRHLSP